MGRCVKGIPVFQYGPPGRSGPTGPRGPQGPQGPTGTGFNYVQAVAALVWTIDHNLGYYPSVEVINAAGYEVDAAVQHTSVNQTLITFLIPTAGRARLN